jgi:hypothetical protein
MENKGLSDLHIKMQQENSSITPSGYFGDSVDNIVSLENFMTQEELDVLNAFARDNASWDITENSYNENGTVIYDANLWDNRVATYDSLMKANPLIVEVINDMIVRLKKTIEDYYNVVVRPTGPAIVRWPVGSVQQPHADKELHTGPDAGKPNAFPHYDIASLFYLNDDYEGGTLYFPVQGVEIRPKVGAAYFFPGDRNYIHGVREVTAGTRYTSPFFWNILDLNKNDK